MCYFPPVEACEHKTLLQQNFLVLKWGCWLTNVEGYGGHIIVVIVDVLLRMVELTDVRVCNCWHISFCE